MSDKSLMIVAGESSGELYGAHLVKELKKIMPTIALFGIGGAKMEKAGVEILQRCENLAVVGLSEVISKLPAVIRAQKKLIKRVKTKPPEGVILIDFPDFNLHLAKKLKPLKIPIIYYISPQVWAWRRSRIKQIGQLVDKMLVILPFERNIYYNSGIPAEFVGHPLVDMVKAHLNRKAFCKKYKLSDDRPIISFLPGSRDKEVKRLLPSILESISIINRCSDAHFILQLAEWINQNDIDKYINAFKDKGNIVVGDAYNVIKNSDIVVVASGTITLESALLGTPMVVLYRLSTPTYFIARLIVKIKYISLVNLLAGELIVTELIQNEVKGENIASEVMKIWENPTKQEEMKEKFNTIKKSLGNGGASTRAAQIIAESIL
jgi:lipid-A-disaccharide synthase